MKFKPVRKKTICDEIVDQFKEMIKSGKLQPGEKLPGERELAKIFNVSRSSVREALLVLSSIGLVRKTNDGSFINDNFSLDYLNFTSSLILNKNDYAELFEARKLIEIITAELAAARDEAEETNLLEEILCDMSDENITIEEFARLDADFHSNIALLSKNKVLFEVVNTISDILMVQVTEKLKIMVEKDEELKIIQDLIQEHRNILVAIKNKDKDMAKKYMYVHLDNAEKNYYEVRKSKP